MSAIPARPILRRRFGGDSASRRANAGLKRHPDLERIQIAGPSLRPRAAVDLLLVHIRNPPLNIKDVLRDCKGDAHSNLLSRKRQTTKKMGILE
jgi:hypothetical protein